MKLLTSIHAKLGDLWWYTMLLFVAQRFGDVINMFVGIWLVPKYVSPEDLGAVLPLSQFVSLIGLPLGIIAIPFMKYLNLYAEKGEFGKAGGNGHRGGDPDRQRRIPEAGRPLHRQVREAVL